MAGERVALVTGASSGFGSLTASLLSRSGISVFGTCRNPKKEENASGNKGFDMLPLDVTSGDSVESCVAEVLAREGRVDVLVNNAGYVLVGGLEETSIDEARAQLETNFFGAVRMVDAVLPTMRQRKTGQIINIGSLSGVFPVPFEGYYGISKAALLAYSQVLRAELIQFNIKVSIVEPGFFKTSLANSKKEVRNPIPDYGVVKERATSRLAEDFKQGGDPIEVSETILKIVRSKRPKFRYAVGKEKRYLFVSRILPSSAMEAGVRRHYGIDR